MSVLQGLEPKSVFHYFEEICAIPHTSYHEKALSDYCVAFAKERGLFCTQDEMGNVIIIAEATQGYEKEPTVILQGHLDMVGDKEEGCTADLLKDGLQLVIDGDFVRAEGTTLGGDDGIAVAYALAILDSADIPHPRLEVVLTVCEEVGLLGATALDLSVCRGQRLINVDSEIEGILTAGCAGGVRALCKLPVDRTETEGAVFTLLLEGLQGGHSGTEIDKGRANANITMGRFLAMLEEKMTYGLAEISGGVKENVIPKSARAAIVAEAEKEDVIREVIVEFQRCMEAEYGTADKDIRMELHKEGYGARRVLGKDALLRVLDLLNLIPNGVQAMSMDLPGLVETSLNMGVLTLTETELQAGISIRSSVASAKKYLAGKAERLTRLLGGSTEFSGDYPAWPYARQSELRDICVALFEKQYGRKPEITAIHAGLECGILSSKLEGLDCISIGPDLPDIHTPRERMSISSAARVWEYLKAILAYKTKD